MDPDQAMNDQDPEGDQKPPEEQDPAQDEGAEEEAIAALDPGEVADDALAGFEGDQPDGQEEQAAPQEQPAQPAGTPPSEMKPQPAVQEPEAGEDAWGEPSVAKDAGTGKSAIDKGPGAYGTHTAPVNGFQATPAQKAVAESRFIRQSVIDQAMKDRAAQAEGMPRSPTLSRAQLDDMWKDANITIRLPPGHQRNAAVNALFQHMADQALKVKAREIAREGSDRSAALRKRMGIKTPTEAEADRKDAEEKRKAEKHDWDRQKFEAEKKAGTLGKQAPKAATGGVSTSLQSGIQSHFERELNKQKVAFLHRVELMNPSEREKAMEAMPAHLRSDEAIKNYATEQTDDRMAKLKAVPAISEVFNKSYGSMPKLPDGNLDYNHATEDQLHSLYQSTLGKANKDDAGDPHRAGVAKWRAENLRKRILAEKARRAARPANYGVVAPPEQPPGPPVPEPEGMGVPAGQGGAMAPMM